MKQTNTVEDNRHTMRHLIDAWTEAIDNYRELTDEERRGILDTMNESYAFRDALRLIALDTGMNVETAAKIAADPNNPLNRGIANISIVGVQDGAITVKRKRAKRAIRNLRTIAELSEDDQDKVNPLSVVAYIQWILGEKTAEKTAKAVLKIDGESFLARGVVRAFEKGECMENLAVSVA